MLGWEFPPHISGGLGTACYGMTKGLDEIGVDVCFVLPSAIPAGTSSHVKLRGPASVPPGTPGAAGIAAAATPVGVEPTTEQIVTREFEHVELHRVQALLQPYGTPQSFDAAVRKMLAEQQIIPGMPGYKPPAGGGGGSAGAGSAGGPAQARPMMSAWTRRRRSPRA